jgi:hypothetical protein
MKGRLGLAASFFECTVCAHDHGVLAGPVGTPPPPIPEGELAQEYEAKVAKL